MYDTDNSVVSFMRRSKTWDTLIFVCNFTPIPDSDTDWVYYSRGEYYEVLNGDAVSCGGSSWKPPENCVPSGPVFLAVLSMLPCLTLPTPVQSFFKTTTRYLWDGDEAK